jgi:hypothetical protein
MPAIATADLIASARAVIAASGCTMLLIERTVRAGKVGIRIDMIAADGGRTRGIARSGDPAMHAVCHTANATLRQLATMLPEGRRDRVGLMTDGTGAAFSPDQLSVMEADWLGAVLSGAALCVDIAPFADDGRWAQLSAPQHGGRAH